MDIGKVPEAVLKRAVIGKAGSCKRNEVMMGSAVGEDCAALELPEGYIFVCSTDPITAAKENTGRLAVSVTANDLASAGAEPVAIMLTILLPKGSDEALLSALMTEVSEQSERLNMEIIGGHTEVTDTVVRPLLSVTGIGRVKKERFVPTGGARPGEDLIVTKAIGIEGTYIIATEHEKELSKRLPQSLIKRAQGFIEDISVVKEGLIACKYGVSSMHDITEGGIYGALWEMCEASGVGCEVDIKRIPVRQETIEIAEVFGLDPCKLISSGSMLISCRDGNGLLQELSKAGIEASFIGRTNETKKRIIRTDGGERFLTPPDVDELHKL